MPPSLPTDAAPRPPALLTLFCAFARVGLFTFGGGYAMLPMLEREIVERQRWATPLELSDIFAMAQTIPGAIAINTATFVGKRQAGIRGAIAATAGMIAPSLIVILLIAMLLEQAIHAPAVAQGMQGIRGTVVGLIAAVAWNTAGRVCRRPAAWGLAGLAAALSLIPGVSVVWIILGAGAGGALRYFYRRRLAGD